MERKTLKGKIQTVLGLIEPDELGITLPHEHIIIDGRMYYVEPTIGSDRKYAHEPVSLANLHWIHHHILNSYDNWFIFDEELCVKELMLFKNAGGDTICDLTPQGMGRDPEALARISRATGLNVIMGTAYYSEASYSKEEMAARSEEDIAEEFVSDILQGSGFFEIRAGIIGELGCTWPLKKNEHKVLVAGAIAQQRTGAGINVHPGRNEKAPMESIKALKESGADSNRIAISHMDRCSYLLENRLEMLEAGCYLEYDLFGTPGYYPSQLSMSEGHLPDQMNDTQRIREMIELIELGWLNKILISHDVCMKMRLQSYGGPGYSHILRNVVPMFKVYGLTNEQIRTIMVENPKCLLTFA